MNKCAYIPERGDVIWLNLDPRTGREQSGRRPAVVLSPKLLSQRTNLAIICPITSKIKGLPFEVPVTGKEIKEVVLPIHIRSVDIQERDAQFIEKMTKKELHMLTESVKALVSPI